MKYTVEPLYHIMDTFATGHFVLYREVFLSSEVGIIEKEPQSASFIESFFILHPLFGVSVIGGSTVLRAR